MKYRGHRTFVANSLHSSPWLKRAFNVSFIRDSALYRNWWMISSQVEGWNQPIMALMCLHGLAQPSNRFKHLSSRSPTEGQNDKTNGLKNLTNGAGGRTGFLAPTCGFALGSFTSEMLSLIWIVMHVDVLGWRHRPLVTRTKDVLVENSPSSLDFCCHVCGNTAIRRQYPCNTVRPFQSSTYIRFKEFKHSLKCK